MVRDPHHRLSTVLDGLPALRERLGNPTEMRSVAMDNERGAMTTTRRLSRVAIGRVALIGDASGSADAITGEGMGMAFRQALLLAECLAASDLERYDRLHSAILKLPQTMACVMLTMDRSEAFRNRALHLLASESALFSRMLGVHLGKEPLLKFVGEKGLEVAWRLIAQSKSQAIQSEWRSTS
jgi:flavin-dependent dehydrogenase